MHVRARAPRRTRLLRYIAVAAGDGNSVVFAEALCEDVPLLLLLLLLEFPRRRRRNLEGVNLSGAWEGGVMGTIHK